MKCESLKHITHIFYDFDGVMTNNQVLVSEDGFELVVCNRSDGLAIQKLKELGYKQLIISTETNDVVEKRAAKLGIPVIFKLDSCSLDKGTVLKEYISVNKVDLKKTIFIGNDINDIPAFELVGVRMCPIDAEDEIKNYPDMIVIGRKGGEGVIRELYRMINQ